MRFVNAFVVLGQMTRFCDAVFFETVSPLLHLDPMSSVPANAVKVQMYCPRPHDLPVTNAAGLSHSLTLLSRSQSSTSLTPTTTSRPSDEKMVTDKVAPASYLRSTSVPTASHPPPPPSPPSSPPPTARRLASSFVEPVASSRRETLRDTLRDVEGKTIVSEGGAMGVT